MVIIFVSWLEVAWLPRRPFLLVAVACVILLGLVAEMNWRREEIKPGYIVSVDGYLVGAVHAPEEARKALEAVMAQLDPEINMVANLAEKLSVRPAYEQERMDLTSQAQIQTALVKVLPSMAEGSVILVDGREIVVVESEEEARTVRDQILEEYRSTILREATVEQLRFQETIDWRTKLVKPDEIRTAAEAMNILKHGTDKLVTYVVQSGDTGWGIARSYNVSTEELARANPDTNLNLLQIGQSLVVTFKEPYVHTMSVSQKVVKERIPFTERIEKDANLWPWQYQVVTPGVSGSRELVIREYRENGQIVKTEVIGNKVLDNPKVQVARQGTKQIPAMGTGSLVYPVAGVTTSYFGPRWGSYHNGIDIGAPTGTPVLAADSGMVVYRGWSGNYGNLVKVDHGEGQIVTWYAHLSRFNINLGDTVQKGDVIGYVGNTGYSTGPHLHYEVHVNGKPVNPLNFYQ